MKALNLFTFSFKMKQFLKYSLFSVLFSIVLMLCVDYTLNSLYINTFDGQSGGKINNLIRNYERVKILAVGDSRSAHHIDPSVLGPNNYNLSHNGQSLIFHTGLLNQIINNEVLKIDTILLTLDIEELNYSNRKKEFDIKRLKYYYKKNKWIKGKINSLKTKEKYKFWLPIYKWNGAIGSIIANKLVKNKFSENGYVPTSPTERDSINVLWQIKDLKYKKFDKRNYSINEKCKSYLTHIKKLCAENRITLVCLFSPSYRQPKIEDYQKLKIVEFFNYNEIKLLDYSNEFYYDKKFRDVWVWADAFHLNHNGATILTNKIREDLNKF